MPHELTAPEREAILTHLKGLPARDTREGAIRLCEFSLPGRSPLFIKQGSDDILVEANTQHFFHLIADSDESAPRIPKIFDAFFEEGLYVVVMEKIEALTLSDCGISDEEAVEHATSAVEWLLAQLPSIPSSCFGRISSKPAPVWHQFFKDHQAPRAFATRNELAKYVLYVRIPHLSIS